MITTEWRAAAIRVVAMHTEQLPEQPVKPTVHISGWDESDPGVDFEGEVEVGLVRLLSDLEMRAEMRDGHCAIYSSEGELLARETSRAGALIKVLGQELRATQHRADRAEKSLREIEKAAKVIKRELFGEDF